MKPKKNIKKITVSGRTLSISEWAAETNLSIRIITYRLSKGWSSERIIKQSATNGNNQHLIY